MKQFDYMAFGAFLLVALTVGIQGCSATRLAIGGEACTVREWQVDDFFTQDVLPGMESNLRKQRIYFVVGAAEAEFNDRHEWLLAVDSVLIPLRARAEESGAWQWSGSRNFYQAVREGVMSMEEEIPRPSFLALEDEAFLIQRSLGQCQALTLPSVRHVGTVAMP
jgi:hypothetical protein